MQELGGKTMKKCKAIVLAAGIVVVIASGLVAEESKVTLYDRLGGMPAIRAVLDNFVARVLADGRVNVWFARLASSPEAAAAYKAKLADLVCQATGGPCRYAGADMTNVHKGRGVTEEAFNA